MGVSEAFQVQRGGFTTLAGDFDRGARAQIGALRRNLDELRVLELALGAATLSLADNQAAYREFTASASRGVVIFGGNIAVAGSGIAAFRVGASAFVTSIAAAGATVTVGTGTLAGTTGTDGHLTIRADSSTSRLYVENRTGAAREYGFAFLGMRVGTPTGSWVTL